MMVIIWWLLTGKIYTGWRGSYLYKTEEKYDVIKPKGKGDYISVKVGNLSNMYHAPPKTKNYNITCSYIKELFLGNRVILGDLNHIYIVIIIINNFKSRFRYFK